MNIIIGIAGGSGSGKTTLAKVIKDGLTRDVCMLEMDSYYKDFSGISDCKRVSINFDHPLSFDFDLLIDHVKKLKNNESIPFLKYDYTKHLRYVEDETIFPQKIIIIEGILLFYEKRIRELIDIKIYVDTDADIRFIRRMRRDTVERGRSFDSVVEQYQSTVRPMHSEFVEPTKKFADIIIPQSRQDQVLVDLIISKISSMINL